jgi:hypothetical protein
MRRMSSLADFIRDTEDRKRLARVTDETIAGARNGGLRRTPEKRALLASMRDRAIENGLEPVEAEF